MKEKKPRRFEMRVDPVNKGLWIRAAAADGRSLAGWLRKIANAACDEADGKRSASNG